MKSKTDVKDAVKQIKETRDKIKELIQKECNCSPIPIKQLGRIKWKACIFHHGSALNNAVKEYSEDFKNYGFCDYKVFDAKHCQDPDGPDAGPFVRGEETAENITKKHKHRKR